jgi:co-chaperonin GroES (HSP10)
MRQKFTLPKAEVTTLPVGNESGWQPYEYNVLVMVDPIAEKTKGGLYLANESQERLLMAQTEGTLIAKSPMAFHNLSSEGYAPWPGEHPKEGQRVKIAKYAGQDFQGKDGRFYRMLKDRDIVGVAL